MGSVSEKILLREAIIRASATEGIARKHCEELITAARAAVGAYQTSIDPHNGKAERRRTRQLWEAMAQLEALVGKP